MFFENILFSLFCFFIIVSALSVIFSENAVYSALFLILTFCNVIFLLLLMGAEFIAFLLLIVYVGAIAVLFLFVVMMLNVKKIYSTNISQYLLYYLPLSFVIFFFLFDYFWNFYSFFDVLKSIDNSDNLTNWLGELLIFSNIESIGNVLYTDFCFLFLTSGFVLLIAMIGVIVLTVHQKTLYLTKKQNINLQLSRNSKNIIKFIDIRKI